MAAAAAAITWPPTSSASPPPPPVGHELHIINDDDGNGVLVHSVPDSEVGVICPMTFVVFDVHRGK